MTPGSAESVPCSHCGKELTDSDLRKAERVTALIELIAVQKDERQARTSLASIRSSASDNHDSIVISCVSSSWRISGQTPSFASRKPEKIWRRCG